MHDGAKGAVPQAFFGRFRCSGRKEGNTMYQYAAQNRNRGGFVSVRNKVMLIVMAVLLVLVIVLGIRSISLSSFRGRAEESFHHSMSSNVSSAISMANKLESTTNSTTSYSLGLVRQYIYSLNQINQMCAGLTGKTYVPQEAFTALFADLDEYQELVLSNKKSTVETREKLLTHLVLVQGYINGELVS